MYNVLDPKALARAEIGKPNEHDAHHMISQLVRKNRVEIPGFEVVGVDPEVCMSGLELIDLNSWAGLHVFESSGIGLLRLDSCFCIPEFGFLGSAC